MKIAVLTKHNSYAGREYISAMISRYITFDIISFGKNKAYDEQEDERCGSLWKPVSFDILSEKVNHYNFSSLKDEKLGSFLDSMKYDIGIQGDAGILEKDVYSRFKVGILNFHPGDLPAYRGCSAPEWQIFEGKPVVCTCHLIDEGLDTGDIYRKEVLNLDYSSYYKMRATVYPETGKFVAEVVSEIVSNGGFVERLIKQDEGVAIHRDVIPDNKTEIIKAILSNRIDEE